MTDFINYICGEDFEKLIDKTAYESPAKDSLYYIDDSVNKGTKAKTYSDADVESLINANKNITTKQKETVKETIEKDGVNNYTININGNESDSELVRKLIDEIERLQKNR